MEVHHLVHAQLAKNSLLGTPTSPEPCGFEPAQGRAWGCAHGIQEGQMRCLDAQSQWEIGSKNKILDSPTDWGPPFCSFGRRALFLWTLVFRVRGFLQISLFLDFWMAELLKQRLFGDIRWHKITGNA